MIIEGAPRAAKRRIETILLALAFLALTALTACVKSGGPPALGIDAAAARSPINPDIYGTSRYNWMVDSSNGGFDWYFMGGSGSATAPVPGASVDLMLNTYKSANALITIPILPYVNKSSAWSCSFPVAEYGAQTSTNPYVPIIPAPNWPSPNTASTGVRNPSSMPLPKWKSSGFLGANDWISPTCGLRLRRRATRSAIPRSAR
jgi:hypothetical protein